MDARLQLRVQRYGWDAAVPHYHTGWDAQLRPAHNQLLEMAQVSAGQRVIETACGSGLVTMRLAEDVGPKGYVLATDLSQGMIDDLQVRLDGRSFALVEAKRMPAEKLDVPDLAFDAAVCALGLTLQIRAGPLSGSLDPRCNYIEPERGEGGRTGTPVEGMALKETKLGFFIQFSSSLHSAISQKFAGCLPLS